MLRPLVLLCVLALAFLFIRDVAAFDPPNVRHYPGSTAASPMVAKVGQSSVMTWSARDEYGWPGWRNVVARALDSDSDDPSSLGRVLNRMLAAEGRGQIVIREARSNESPDMVQHAVSTAFMVAKCGAEWATACVFLLNPVPNLPAYYKSAAMLPWPFESQAAVVRHETFHALSRACDQYRGGCPRTSDGVWESMVVCTGNTDTLMDCGGAARTSTAYDFVTFKTAFAVDTLWLQVIPIAPPCVPVEGAPCWTGEGWKFASGWGFVPNDGCGNWYDPFNRHAWGECSDYGRYSPLLDKWVAHGSRFYDYRVNYHYPVP